MTKPLATLITPVHLANAPLVEMTEKLYLKSLARNGYQDKVEIILIDDASPLSDAFTPMVQRARTKLGLNIRVIRNETNLGFPGSINVGMEAADTDLLIMTNNDIYVPKGTIERMSDLMKQDPDIAAIGPRTNNANHYSAQEFFSDFIIEAYQDSDLEAIDQVAMKASADKRLYQVKWLIGSFMMFRKKYCEQAGGIDLDYQFGYYEETDLLSRIRRLGKKIIVDRSLFVFHGYAQARKNRIPMGPSMRSVFLKAHYFLYKNNLKFIRKRGVKEWLTWVYEWHYKRNFDPYHPPTTASSVP